MQNETNKVVRHSQSHKHNMFSHWQRRHCSIISSGSNGNITIQTHNIKCTQRTGCRPCPCRTWRAAPQAGQACSHLWCAWKGEGEIGDREEMWDKMQKVNGNKTVLSMYLYNNMWEKRQRWKENTSSRRRVLEDAQTGVKACVYDRLTVAHMKSLLKMEKQKQNTSLTLLVSEHALVHHLAHNLAVLGACPWKVMKTQQRPNTKRIEVRRDEA